MICLWCWQSLQMLCGNRQGLILASEFFCGIPDIFSILGEGVSLEVEMWSLYLARPPQVEFCLRSCISSPGPHRFCTLAFVTLQGFLNVSCGCVWSLCSLPACVSIFRLCAAIAGQHFKGFFFFCNVVPAFHMLWKYRREKRSVRERVRWHAHTQEEGSLYEITCNFTFKEKKNFWYKDWAKHLK